MANVVQEIHLSVSLIERPAGRNLFPEKVFEIYSWDSTDGHIRFTELIYLTPGSLYHYKA